jgi:hypothetical protein
MDSVTAERFLNSYHNASPPPSPDVPEDVASFILAADRVLAEAAELARVHARAHQGAATEPIGQGWAHTRKSFSLSDQYAGWADYRPIRLTNEEFRAHPEWWNLGDELDDHPAMRGWRSVPLIGSDGENYGFTQASDRLEGEFTEQDETPPGEAGGAHVDGSRRARAASSARLSAEGCGAACRVDMG